MSDTVYFAHKEANEVADVMLDRANSWFHQLTTNGYLYKLRDTWLAYNGAYYSDASSGHQITFGGEQGELVNLAINHFRNIGQHMLTMVTSNRPAMDAVAVNTDVKSLKQAKLANTLLEYYLRNKGLEEALVRAVEYAITMAAGYVKMEWNDTTGDIYDTNPDTGAPIFEGDVEFDALSPFDVFLDSTKQNAKHDWVMCRKFVNKFDLAEKYPEHKKKIINMPSKAELYKYRFDLIMHEDTDDIPVYEFYHKPTDSMPDGRYVFFASSDIVFLDMEMPYRELPIYRISPADMIGTPYGYTPLFDLLPIQDAINSLYSTVMTNQSAFGVQNLYVDRAADINFKALDGGLNLIEGTGPNGKPQPLQLTNTPKEVFDFIGMLEKAMETVSGISSVTRGDPSHNLRTGTALAMVHTVSLQYISGLQHSYTRLIEDVGTGLIHMLRDFAKVPRVAMIAGINNSSYVEDSFTGDDLSQVNRVMVKVGNPLAKTHAGRIQMASELIQYGIIKTPEQYFTVLNTGNLDTMTDDAQDELFLIRDENERMMDGRAVKASPIDEHIKHIKRHRAVLNKSEIRLNNEIASRVFDHIMEHVNYLRTIDPALLSIIGEQPLGPQGGSAPASPAPQVNQGSAPEAPMEQAPTAPEAAGAGQPGVPSPPEPFQNMPVDPSDIPQG